MFKKFILTFAAVFALTVGVVNVSALDDNVIYKEIGIFTAQVYVCDDVNETVVLKSVEPHNMTETEAAIAQEAEYTEISINPRLIRDGNSFIYMRTVNAFLLDKTATVVIGRNNYGLEVIYMQF